MQCLPLINKDKDWKKGNRLATKSNYIGIDIFGVILIINSLMTMVVLATQSHWYIDDLYAHWPQWAAVVRYTFSWFQRLLGLTAGVGILLRRDLFRKLALVIACFTISTVYWKHPYVAYYFHTQKITAIINQAYLQAGLPPISANDIVMPALILNCLLDIGFSLWLIAYFTKPGVVLQFQENKKNNEPPV